MSRQSLEEKTTINFPRSVDEEEAMKIIEHITTNFGDDCRIWGNFSGCFLVLKGRIDMKYVSKISGKISRKESTTIFYFLRDEKNLQGNFSGLKFDIPPEYDLEELDQVEVKSYDEIRRSIGSYFDNS